MDVCINNNKAKSHHQKLCSQQFAKKKVDYQLFNVPCKPVQKKWRRCRRFIAIIREDSNVYRLQMSQQRQHNFLSYFKCCSGLGLEPSVSRKALRYLNMRSKCSVKGDTHGLHFTWKINLSFIWLVTGGELYTNRPLGLSKGYDHYCLIQVKLQ